ncbi:Nicotinamide riboside kinase 2 [Trichinella britovi]|uniref:Nicotinamide riboside kinase 2 n=2 Tax=Trichinella TaxID=6333 RepID=A0A0V1CPD3_TRIBR|nr:Nicotinamide riboside kinase 2 [Trichinella murrelli]KRY51179.1 Nicotinamide riboside kinase 2 [Trichinella britovi]
MALGNLTFLFGIGGATCSGKTTVSKIVARELELLSYNVDVVHQDSYYKTELDDVYLADVNFWNFDSIDAVDFPKLLQRVQLLCAENCCRSKVSIIIVEGSMIYHFPPLHDMFKEKFFFTIDKNSSKLRRRRRQYEIADVECYFEKYVWPSYLNSLKMAEDNADSFLFVNGEDELNENISYVLREIMKHVVDDDNNNNK